MSEPTTKAELLEALRRAEDSAGDHGGYTGRSEWLELIDLASRLPTTCAEAHEPTVAMLLAGRIVRDGLGGFDTSSIYRAMERARVAAKGKL